MKQKLKKAMIGVICLVVLLSLAACGSGSSNTSSDSNDYGSSSSSSDSSNYGGSGSSSGSSNYGSSSSSSDSSNYGGSDTPTYEDPITGETYTQEEMEDFVDGLSKGFESGKWDSENGFYQP